MNHSSSVRLINSFGILIAVALVCGAPCRGDEFIPVTEVVVSASLNSTDAETLSLKHFARSVKKFTGIDLGSSTGAADPQHTTLITGTRHSHQTLFDEQAWLADAKLDDELHQSYVVATLAKEGDTPRRLVAVGFGTDRTPRASLGMGYALGELLRRLDLRDGVWGFAIPTAPIICSPAMPNRTIYLMNSNHMNPGLSLELMSAEEIHAYADFLVVARYSRVSFWQWSSFYLYPGNEKGGSALSVGAWTAETERDQQARRARNQRVHQAMRCFFAYARRRGLEVYHQLSPMHANVDLLPADPKFAATGYYGRSSVCWAQPEGRELARRMAQAEMEYFGPVDGYIVWFYDPGGCFCDTCYPNQAEHLFQQFSMVEELAITISPGAKFQVVLWPTWCFHETKGIPYKSVTEVQEFVSSFLKKMRQSHPRRSISIMDTCELEHSNLYNGLVDPQDFKRTAFLYSVLGLPSESAYPFASFRLNELATVLGRARDRDLEDATLFLQYTATNMPAVFAFADVLYEKSATAEQTAIRYAKTIAKGGCQQEFANLLLQLDQVRDAQKYPAKERALTQALEIGESVMKDQLFFGDQDWLRGQLLAQKHYLGMARAGSSPRFLDHLSKLKREIGDIPMYRDFVTNVLTADLAGQHVKTYWRGPLNDTSVIGLPTAP